MADAAEVFAGITRRPGTRYTALVPNLAGLERALAAGVTEIAVFAASTETFSRKNINQSIDESLADVRGRSASARSRPACASAAICRRRSAVRTKARCRRTRWPTWPRGCSALGVFEVRSATPSASRIPARCRGVLDAVLARVPARARSRCTSTTRAARRSRTCWPRCPSASRRSTRRPAASAAARTRPGAAGNLATDDLIYMLDGLGIETGVSLAALTEASAFIAARLDHRLPSRYSQATPSSAGLQACDLRRT